MIFLFNLVISRFYIDFRGCTNQYITCMSSLWLFFNGFSGSRDSARYSIIQEVVVFFLHFAQFAVSVIF